MWTRRRGWQSGPGCRSFCWCCRSTCWATGCATRWIRGISELLRLDATLLDDACPLLLLPFQVRGGRLGRARDYRQPALFVELHLVGRGEDLADVRIQRIDNRARRA